MAYIDEAKEHWQLRLNHHSPVPLWTQVARELRRRIAEWNLPVGHSMPSVQFLADQHGIGRNTVRQAYRALGEAGMIEPKHGAGYCVAEHVTTKRVQIPPGSTVTAPAADPDMHPDIPAWLVVAFKVETPGMEPIWYDASRTTLIVS